MKHSALIILGLCMSCMAVAQKYVPKISVGTVFSYSVTATSSGQQIPLTLTINSLASPLSMKWDVEGYGTGIFEITDTAFAKGTKMRISQPAPNQVTRLKDDQTIMLISKSTFADLTQNRAFTVNGVKFTVVSDNTPYKINDKEADVIHAATSNGAVNVWILNNPDFPLLCQFTGNPQGIDFTLTTVKE